MQPELGAEVGDRLRRKISVFGGEPCVFCFLLAPEFRHHPVVRFQEARIPRAVVQTPRIDSTQDRNWVVAGQVPQRLVEYLEYTPRNSLPAPRHVGGDVSQPFDAFWKVGKAVPVDGHRA
jgi:hypothetical protein